MPTINFYHIQHSKHTRYFIRWSEETATTSVRTYFVVTGVVEEWERGDCAPLQCPPQGFRLRGALRCQPPPCGDLPLGPFNYRKIKRLTAVLRSLNCLQIYDTPLATKEDKRQEEEEQEIHTPATLDLANCALLDLANACLLMNATNP